MAKNRSKVTLAPPMPTKGLADMPVGLSASSAGLYGHTSNLRRILMLTLPLVILLGIALGAWAAVGRLSAFGQKSITNGIYTYTFTFYKAAEPVNLELGHGLQYKDKAWVIAAPTNEKVEKECSKFTGNWETGFTATVEGAERPVCTDGEKTFFVIFYHNDTKHLFEITYASKKDANKTDVRKFIESLGVALG